MAANSIISSGPQFKESTVFEKSSTGRTGFELPALKGIPEKKPVQFARQASAELPEMSELEVVRHFTRLSSWNYAIDLGIFPLGSCTMKYNPRINEEIATLPGFCDIHPDLPEELVQGALELQYRLELALQAISGLDAVSLQPAAGAHGELTGLMAIKSFFNHRDVKREIVLIPDTAHGTNPASSVLAGFKAVTITSGSRGIVELETVREAVEKYGRNIAALMMTNPNTGGLFEANILAISELLHSVGAQVYMDGANMNAILGKAKPKDMGVDVMQYNLHKTFSTPHGGGGPGSGPVAVRSHLAPYLPGPRIRKVEDRYEWHTPAESVGKVKGNFGNFGMMVRALAYIYHHGSEGLARVSKNAVLNANYIRHRLRNYYDVPFDVTNFHECLLTDQKQASSKGVKTLQIAKALIDRGFHPPTVYFPLTVSGAMLIEPTETESLQDIDSLCDAFIEIAEQIEAGETFENAPRHTFVSKVDEVNAARRLILTFDDRTQT